MKVPARRLLALALGIVVALLVAEVLCRLIPSGGPPPRALYFRDASGERASRSEAVRRGILRPVPAELDPRPESPRMGFAPGARFSICYEGERMPWHDERGCVEVRFNSHGIRERESIGPDKPEGHKRLLCLGDSFTMGWGVAVEDCWVRRLEHALREHDDSIRTVNCGAAGTTVVDEYWYGLRHRFARFEPDAVVVTLCLNDLMISNSGLSVMVPAPDTPSALLDRILRVVHDPLAVPAGRDPVEESLALPPDHPLYHRGPGTEVSYEMLWPSGTPQKALTAMRDWCRERDLPLMVVLWPFLQGLGPGQRYPFSSMHERVRAFCAEQGIPFLDLLPALRGHPSRSLWVHPTDMHANPRAHALVVPHLERFTRSVTGW